MWSIRSDAIRHTCRSHYPDELLQRWASGPMPDTFPQRIERGHFVVGVAESAVVGFAALNETTAQVDAVFVSPWHGRRGLGRQLLAHLEQTALAMDLHELDIDASLNAVPFYRAAGYRAISEGVYVTSAGVEIPCVRMRKRLDPLAKRSA